MIKYFTTENWTEDQVLIVLCGYVRQYLPDLDPETFESATRTYIQALAAPIELITNFLLFIPSQYPNKQALPLETYLQKISPLIRQIVEPPILVRPWEATVILSEVEVQTIRDYLTSSGPLSGYPLQSYLFNKRVSFPSPDPNKSSPYWATFSVLNKEPKPEIAVNIYEEKDQGTKNLSTAHFAELKADYLMLTAKPDLQFTLKVMMAREL